MMRIEKICKPITKELAMEKSYRSIKRIVRGVHTTDGAGVHLVRVVGQNDIDDFDPFLMLDAFDSDDPADYVAGFPWHPHRGIETVTYLIEGDIEHGDSLGNRGSIKDGDCQWMTAGSGIIHQEMPQATDSMLGAQLWLNLPADDKMCDPQYGDIQKENVPVVKDDIATVRVLAGSYGEIEGAFQGQHVPTTYLDVEVNPNQEWEFQSDPEATLFVYLVSGSASFDGGENFEDHHQAVLFTQDEYLRVKAGKEGARMLLLQAHPLHEPVAWGGPVVMNTDEELRQAFKDIRNDTFIRHEPAM